MKGFEIRSFLYRHYPEMVPHFKGIFAYNSFPKRFKNKEFAVVNKASLGHDGTHWFTIVKLDTFEIFDSLGKSQIFVAF